MNEKELIKQEVAVNEEFQLIIDATTGVDPTPIAKNVDDAVRELILAGHPLSASFLLYGYNKVSLRHNQILHESLKKGEEEGE